jgi:hypothetical protein
MNRFENLLNAMRTKRKIVITARHAERDRVGPGGMSATPFGPLLFLQHGNPVASSGALSRRPVRGISRPRQMILS